MTVRCLVDGDPVSLEALTFARDFVARSHDVEAVTIAGEYAPEAWARRSWSWTPRCWSLPARIAATR